MKYIGKLKGEDVLSCCELILPKASEWQVVARLLGTSINRADILQRQGRYPVPAGHSPVMGLDCVCQHQGRKYIALLNGGGYATHALVDRRLMLPLPESHSVSQGAAIMQVWLTAYQILKIGDVDAGKRVLIYAGASGVGTAAIQLCSMFGAQPIALCSGQRKVSACRDLGAVAIDYKENQNWDEIILKEHGQVDIVLDCVGQSHFAKGLKVLAVDGTVVLYGTLSGTKMKEFDLGSLLAKRVNVRSTTLRSRKDDYKAKLVESFGKEAFDWVLSKGRLLIHKELCCDWGDKPEQVFRQAHQLIESNQTIGKVVVTWL